MNIRQLLIVAALFGWTFSCAHEAKPGAGVEAEAKQARGEPEDLNEVKVSLDKTPPAVRATIQRELVGAELEDIAMEQRGGKTIYETDIIRGGKKWELIVAEDGSIISKA